MLSNYNNCFFEPSGTIFGIKLDTPEEMKRKNRDLIEFISSQIQDAKNSYNKINDNLEKSTDKESDLRILNNLSDLIKNLEAIKPLPV